jgi:hypothetical protein
MRVLGKEVRRARKEQSIMAERYLYIDINPELVVLATNIELPQTG